MHRLYVEATVYTVRDTALKQPDRLLVDPGLTLHAGISREMFGEGCLDNHCS